MSKIIEYKDNYIMGELSSFIDEIFREYSFLKIKKSTYYKLAQKVIENSKYSVINNSMYIVVLKEKILENVDLIISERLSKEETAIVLINRFINKFNKKKFSYEAESLNVLLELGQFLNKYNFAPSKNLLSSIIKNNIFFNVILESIFNYYRDIIISNNMGQIFNSNTETLIMKTYLSMNNIRIKSSKDVDCSSSLNLYLREIYNHHILTSEEEKQLFMKINLGDEDARKKVIESNLRLVVHIAKKYRNTGLPLLDLIQEGNIGLIESTYKYNPNLNVRFYNYAPFWIERNIIISLKEKTRNIKMSHDAIKALKLYQKNLKKFEEKLGRRPTDYEIANEFHLSFKQLDILKRNQYDTLSLNFMMEDDGEKNALDYYTTLDFSLEENLSKDEEQFQIRKFLKQNLSDEELNLLISRFGLGGNEIVTLSETAKSLGVSYEVIRQKEAKIIRKLRTCPDIYKLLDYSVENEDVIKKRLQDFKDVYKRRKRKSSFLGLENFHSPGTLDKLSINGKTIYKFLPDYTKEQIDLEITYLPVEEKLLLGRIFGNDFSKIVFIELNEEDTKKLKVLLSKLKMAINNRNTVLRKASDEYSYFPLRVKVLENTKQDKRFK